MDDRDRPLTPRGREDAMAVGAFLAESGAPPDLALASPSARTRETLAGVCARLAAPPDRIFNPAIYDASAQVLLAAVCALPDRFGHVLVVGHNPGIHLFAASLAAPQISDDTAVSRIAAGFAKGALATFELDIETWRETGFGAGRLTGYVRPKDLRRKSAC